MIRYSRSNFFWRIIQWEGSVFPVSAAIAVPCAALASLLKFNINDGLVNVDWLMAPVIDNSNAWSGLVFLLGFLIVFRTSQSYARFWEGTSAVIKMRAEWLDACSSLIAFCEQSKASAEKTKEFKQVCVRLFSMMLALALGQLDTDNVQGSHAAFKYELLDAEGLDKSTLAMLRDSDHKVDLAFLWIQKLIVHGISSQVLAIPPPILSRAFNELANGMSAMESAMKVSTIPFPFPYAQVCDALLFFHWLCIPWVVATAQWVSDPSWAFILTFLQTFVLWALNFIAKELEQPFGTDPNDIDGHALQVEMNSRLQLMVHPMSERVPFLVEGIADYEKEEDWSKEREGNFGSCQGFTDIWKNLPSGAAGSYFQNVEETNDKTICQKRDRKSVV